MTNWRKVADRLAGRLLYQVGGCACDPPDPAECPFCADTAAYGEYLRAGGTVRPYGFETAAVTYEGKP